MENQVFKANIERNNFVSSRNISEYISSLKVSEKFLDGKKVLNFGCGNSNLNADLNKILDHETKGLIIDLDIEYNPQQEKKFTESGEKRNLIIYNGKDIPFPDNSVDICLALWSTYQIPPEEKERAFNEIIRVSKICHITPVSGHDIELIKEACKKYKSKIILQREYLKNEYYGKLVPDLNTIEDYKNLARTWNEVYEPKRFIELDLSDDGKLSAWGDEMALVIIVREELLND